MEHADFVHLHVHTQYSLLDGACRLDKLISKAAECKLPALSITDHGNLYGAIKFYQLCLKKGIKPIIGCELYVADNSRLNKDGKTSGENYHLVVLAKDMEGYSNLVKLVSLANLEGFYYKPRVDKELLNNYNKGLIALSACLKGEIPFLIGRGEIGRAYKKAEEYMGIFGRGNFYLEIMLNGLKEQEKVNRYLLEMSKKLDIPLVATNDIHYIEKEEAFAHEVLLCLQTQTTMLDARRFKFRSDSFYFRSPAEMKELFRDFPGAIRNTIEITQKCNLTFDFSDSHLPVFPLPEGESGANEYLRKLCVQNIKDRYGDESTEILSRLEYELGVIKKTGFSSYFLIIWDLIKFAKGDQVPVGPGRGSAAGSIVSYLLGITDIDPLEYGLIFERFLNPERISMPDIDIDFCYENREKVFDYVCRKYGRDCVAQIITFGTLLARMAIRDVGRVLGLSYSEVDKIAKMLPSSLGNISLKEALKISPELNRSYQEQEQIRQLIDTAMKLEGLSRHASTHAAGVVISDKPLMERIPLMRGSEGEIVTGFDMESVEKTGLLKMDFLGLKTLTVIEGAVKIIRRTRKVDLDISSISLEDVNTYELLAQGDTSGVFQLESRGMREILKKMRPSEFRDIIAILALYRPGPLASGLVSDFIDRKQGKKKVEYFHPLLESILKETYGIILYQEQTMQIASKLAGFSLSQADLLRKAIGKKNPVIMEEQQAIFIEGCEKNSIPRKTAGEIFSLIDYFSGYGFNKSHSTAYALITYRTAYLKANYSVEFMAALLTSERTNTDKIVEYINEAKRMNIEVLPPDINTSFASFTVFNQSCIRFGLLAIKNVGSSALENIVRVRSERLFSDFFDFVDRVDPRIVNKKVVESLIKSGAMDSLGLKRSQMMACFDIFSERSQKKSRIDERQMVLFEQSTEDTLRIPDIEEWPKAQILCFEKELLGMYISSHPVCSWRRQAGLFDALTIDSLYGDEFNSDNEMFFLGVVDKVKPLTTRKKKQRMAIIKIEDETAAVEAVLFPKVYEESAEYLKQMDIVLLKGRVENKDRMPKIIASRLLSIEGIWERVREVTICLRNKDVDLKKLKRVFVDNQGQIPVRFVLKNERLREVKVKPSRNFHLRINERVIGDIASLTGWENLSLTL